MYTTCHHPVIRRFLIVGVVLAPADPHQVKTYDLRFNYHPVADVVKVTSPCRSVPAIVNAIPHHTMHPPA